MQGVYKHHPHQGFQKGHVSSGGGVKGSIPWNKGAIGLRKHTEATKLKMSLTHKGRKKKPFSELARRNMSEAGKKSFADGRVHPRGMLGKKTSEATKEKLRQYRGAKAANWKGGVTHIHQAIRTSTEYRLWRKAVFERDNFTCVECAVRNGKGVSVRLEADHIKPFALFPELRFAIDNGRTLCAGCHRKTDTYGGFWGRVEKKLTKHDNYQV